MSTEHTSHADPSQPDLGEPHVQYCRQLNTCGATARFKECVHTGDPKEQRMGTLLPHCGPVPCTICSYIAAQVQLVVILFLVAITSCRP
jgi:hypothetical protein